MKLKESGEKLLERITERQWLNLRTPREVRRAEQLRGFERENHPELPAHSPSLFGRALPLVILLVAVLYFILRVVVAG